MKAPIMGQPIKLTFIVTAKITANTFVSKFARFAAENGFDVTVIADGVDRSRQAVGRGFLSYVPVSMVREPHIVRDLKSLILLYSELRKSKPDIITYATPKASLLGAFVGFTLRVPRRVYQVWGLRLETTRGLNRKILAVMERLTSILSTRVLANSESLASRYRAMGLNQARNVDVLGYGSSHGVDLEYFSKDSPILELDFHSRDFLAEKNKQLTIGFVGRLHPDKGIDVLLDAVELIKASGLNINLLLIGEDEGAEFKSALEPGIDYIKISHVADVRPYYLVMDVLVLPSLREGFPNVVLEAAAMSVPAIVSNGTGVVDSVIHGETGFIIPVGDSEALAQALTKFVADSELKLDLGAAARRRVEECFSQEEVWERTLNYLQL